MTTGTDYDLTRLRIAVARYRKSDQRAQEDREGRDAEIYAALSAGVSQDVICAETGLKSRERVRLIGIEQREKRGVQS